MGNSLGGKKTTKVMKINGETLKLKTPVKAAEVIKDFPGHVLLESEAVKHYGIRAKPLEPQQNLVPKRLYFLVQLPEAPTETVPRRVRSGINMSAKDRLESLMLSRRSTSDLSILKPKSNVHEESTNELESGAVRIKMRLSKAEVEKLMQESKDGDEAAAKIVDLCMANTDKANGKGLHGIEGMFMMRQQVPRTPDHGRVGEGSSKSREKRVSFLPVGEREMQIAVATY
ncbi:hypothetical protein K2173_001468 [Erythroxylum novogranatense]|uniref:Plastid movement impaired 2 n=1 Tax=Erythroxylum novogranatense TaxID=1862640 RepID=A0AAV8TRY4_9ROSI|nr:hypothetical protein K2173_001468 [Erythroxylum novogranatense]